MNWRLLDIRVGRLNRVQFLIWAVCCFVLLYFFYLLPSMYFWQATFGILAIYYLFMIGAFKRYRDREQNNIRRLAFYAGFVPFWCIPVYTPLAFAIWLLPPVFLAYLSGFVISFAALVPPLFLRGSDIVDGTENSVKGGAVT